MIEFDNLTYLHGKPQGTGLLKANPEDFVVVEDLGFEPDGEGEHILVRILKNGCRIVRQFGGVIGIICVCFKR